MGEEGGMRCSRRAIDIGCAPHLASPRARFGRVCVQARFEWLAGRGGRLRGPRVGAWAARPKGTGPVLLCLALRRRRIRKEAVAGAFFFLLPLNSPTPRLFSDAPFVSLDPGISPLLYTRAHPPWHKQSHDA